MDVWYMHGNLKSFLPRGKTTSSHLLNLKLKVKTKLQGFTNNSSVEATNSRSNLELSPYFFHVSKS